VKLDEAASVSKDDSATDSAEGRYMFMRPVSIEQKVSHGT